MLVFTITLVNFPGAWIRAERARLGISTRDLARLAGVSYPTISRIENGHAEPRWSTLAKVFEVLGHPLAPSTSTRKQTRLADLSEAWSADAMGKEHPDWVRLRGLADQVTLRPALVAQAILPEPPRSTSPVMDTLLAAMAEKLADDAGIARPRWTRQRPPLQKPWSVETRPSKRDELQVPEPFLRRGLLIPESTIWRDRDLALA